MIKAHLRLNAMKYHPSYYR